MASTRFDNSTDRRSDGSSSDHPGFQLGHDSFYPDPRPTKTAKSPADAPQIGSRPDHVGLWWSLPPPRVLSGPGTRPPKALGLALGRGVWFENPARSFPIQLRLPLRRFANDPHVVAVIYV